MINEGWLTWLHASEEFAPEKTIKANLLRVGVTVVVGVLVGVSAGVPVGVGVGVSAGVSAGVPVGVTVGVTVEVGVGVGVISIPLHLCISIPSPSDID